MLNRFRQLPAQSAILLLQFWGILSRVHLCFTLSCVPFQVLVAPARQTAALNTKILGHLPERLIPADQKPYSLVLELGDLGRKPIRHVLVNVYPIHPQSINRVIRIVFDKPV